MPSHSRTIPLTFNRKDFEEIYFKDRHGSFFFAPNIKNEFYAFLVTLLLLVCSIVYSLYSDKGAGRIVFFAILAGFLCILYLKKVFSVYAYRKSITDFFDKNERIASHKIVLTESSFALIQDGKESIHKWTAFTHAEINDDYVMLTGPLSYFIPRKSFLSDDYDFFLKEIRTRIQNRS